MLITFNKQSLRILNTKYNYFNFKIVDYKIVNDK